MRFQNRFGPKYAKIFWSGPKTKRCDQVHFDLLVHSGEDVKVSSSKTDLDQDQNIFWSGPKSFDQVQKCFDLLVHSGEDVKVSSR
jgi:hypothetical protein